jgi:hypothetical protein
MHVFLYINHRILLFVKKDQSDMHKSSHFTIIKEGTKEKCSQSYFTIREERSKWHAQIVAFYYY